MLKVDSSVIFSSHWRTLMLEDVLPGFQAGARVSWDLTPSDFEIMSTGRKEATFQAQVAAATKTSVL